VVCETDEQWQALAPLIGAADLAGLGVDERRQRSEEIDRLIDEWTSALDPAEAQQRLQAAAIPAHMVNDAADAVADPQLAHRHHFQQVAHAKHGTTWVEGGNYTLSRTPGRVDWGGPMFGQHNMEVLEGILGYDGDRIAELVIAGAIA